MKIIIIPNNSIMTARHYCLAKSLTAKGHEVHYALWELPYNIKPKELVRHIFTSLVPKQYVYEGLIIHKVSRLPYFWPVVNGWLFHHQIRTLYKRISADIIFAEGYTNEITVPKDLPFIYDLADDYAAPAEVYGSAIYKLAFKLLGVQNVMKNQCKHALAVTVVSDILYKYGQKYNDTVIKLPNGVDTKTINEVKREVQTKAINPYSLIYVTGFGQWSRPIETIRTVIKLRADFPEIELNLVGHGSEVEKMKQYISDKNVANYVHYLGFVSDRKKLFQIINESAIGLNISDKNKWRDAAHPIKVIEYSAMGKAVVSTDLVEVQNLKFSNLYIFNDKSPKTSFEASLRRALLDAKKQPSYKKLSATVLATYDWETITDKLIKIMEDSLRARPMV